MSIIIKKILEAIKKIGYQFYSKNIIKKIKKWLSKFVSLKSKKDIIPFIEFDRFNAKNYMGSYPWSLHAVTIDHIVEGIDIFNPHMFFLFSKYPSIGLKFNAMHVYLYDNYPTSFITKWFIKNTVIGSLRYIYLDEVISIRCFMKFKNILIFSYIVNKSTFGQAALINIERNIGEDLRSKKAGFYSGSCYPASICFDVLAFAPVNQENWPIKTEWDLYLTTIYYP